MSSPNSNKANSAGGAARKETLAALLLVSSAGIAALYDATLGLRVVATEEGRRLQLREHPIALPPTLLSMPKPTALLENLRQDCRVAIVTFMYSRCNAVCSALGSQYQQMQSQIIAHGLQHKVRLLSVSFDPRDSAPVLLAYARQQHAQSAVWQFASVADATQRQRLLSSMGIVVVPAPLGEFVHNAAFHIVDPGGRLGRIVDLDEPDAALRYALATAHAW
ncbi:SCO family protein [Massilia sp. PWRC2]|uniref:SCO family protein n=1 Tax=Massilia sp. PWRC2 TaxID=2804626 RepID=UPI003CF46D2B